MERCLITGASGFIGQALSQELSTSYEVIAGDRLGKCPKVDYVIDLASYGNAYHQQDLVETYETNMMRLVRLVEASKEHPIKGMIFTSSAVVNQPHLNYYGASKMGIEALAKAVTHCPVVTLRPYTVTGVGDQPHHLIPTLIRSCLDEEQMPFVGTPSHDFVDIEDMAKAYAEALRSVGRLSGRVLGIGTGMSYTNREVRSLVESVTHRKANTFPVRSMRSYDSQAWVADTNDLCLLGYFPTKSLRTSIREMVEVANAQRRA